MLLVVAIYCLYHLASVFKNGHVHKYEAVLWTLEKLRKTIFCYKMINFSLRESKFFSLKESILKNYQINR